VESKISPLWHLPHTTQRKSSPALLGNTCAENPNRGNSTDKGGQTHGHLFNLSSSTESEMLRNLKTEAGA
uniref:Uncharacterized protein n=1 Tax=Scleropages formosus TaxID=113540 RepID=A0A8C9RT40_SCLFO